MWVQTSRRETVFGEYVYMYVYCYVHSWVYGWCGTKLLKCVIVLKFVILYLNYRDVLWIAKWWTYLKCWNEFCVEIVFGTLRVWDELLFCKIVGYTCYGYGYLGHWGPRGIRVDDLNLWWNHVDIWKCLE